MSVGIIVSMIWLMKSKVDWNLQTWITGSIKPINTFNVRTNDLIVSLLVTSTSSVVRIFTPLCFNFCLSAFIV